jgi:glycosyltransferase involved in cell wall biosynthesis
MMRITIFAGGLYTTLSARTLPLAEFLQKRYNITTEIIMPIPWNFIAKGKIGNILSVILTYRIKEYIKAATKSSDIVMIRKTANTQTYIFQKILKERGVKVLFDIDDALFLPSSNIFGIKIRPGTFFLEKILRNSDYVLTNGHFLLHYVREFNKNSCMIHDPIDTELFSPEKKIRNAKQIVIGWQGNARIHSRNLAMLINPLKRIGKEYRNIKFKIVSYLGDESITRMFSPLEKYMEIDYGTKNWVPLRSFAKMIYNFDILVAPLEDTPWNRGKSALRVGIGMALGIPVVASPVGEQKYVIRHGVNGFLANNEEEWYTYLKILIEDEHLRKKMGKEGRKIAENELSLEVNGKKLYEIIKRTLEMK